MEPAEPPYLRIAADIRRRITAGELRPGERVPSTRAITREWGVALATATKALNVLREEGLVRAVPRAGTVVAEPPALTTPHARTSRQGGSLSRDRIVRTAIDIADAGGLAALSMRGVAGQLGVPTMSLYRHVRGKDELVLLMLDATFGEAPLAGASPAGWRPGLERVARQQWASYRRHPWLAQLISLTRPQPVVNLFMQAEWTFRALADLELDHVTLFDVHLTLSNFVRGIAVNLAPEAEAQADTGMSSDEWVETTGSAALITSGRFPTFASVAARGDYDLDLDSLFEFGLHRMLDGLGVFFARRS